MADPTYMIKPVEDGWVVSKWTDGELPEATYDVKRTETPGELSCECWPYFKKKTCKHIAMVRKWVAENPSDSNRNI